MTECDTTPVSQASVVVLITLIASVIHPSMAMCESRCEHSIPSLNRLRSLWSRSFKRMGEVRVSFESFLLYLVQDSSSENDMMKQLRVYLLRIIARYQDCVMACEHQFSKRQQPLNHKQQQQLQLQQHHRQYQQGQLQQQHLYKQQKQQQQVEQQLPRPQFIPLLIQQKTSRHAPSGRQGFINRLCQWLLFSQTTKSSSSPSDINNSNNNVNNNNQQRFLSHLCSTKQRDDARRTT